MCSSSGMASSPMCRVSYPSRWLSLVFRILISLFGLSETKTIGYSRSTPREWGLYGYARPTTATTLTHPTPPGMEPPLPMWQQQQPLVRCVRTRERPWMTVALRCIVLEVAPRVVRCSCHARTAHRGSRADGCSVWPGPAVVSTLGTGAWRAAARSSRASRRTTAAMPFRPWHSSTPGA